MRRTAGSTLLDHKRNYDGTTIFTNNRIDTTVQNKLE
jgi:hypothetical protein